jgi:transposase
VSLPLRLVPPVPEDTARVAHTAFPRGNPYLQFRDELGTVFHDTDFADLYPRRGQPAFAPWRLALITVLQFREDLSDRAAAEAVRARIDWKYLLGLELTDPGFDASVLCEFRSRLLPGGGEGWGSDSNGEKTTIFKGACVQWARRAASRADCTAGNGRPIRVKPVRF